MKKTLLILLAMIMTLSTLMPMTGALASAGDELVDGRFVEMRKITVEVYDRGNDGGSTPENNVYTDFIKEGMLRDHNVEVTFVPVGRWVEVEQLNNLLSANDAPDICVTYNYPTIQTYANMGGVIDMAPYVNENKDLLPDLWDLLGEMNVYYNRDPESGTIWAIEALKKNVRQLNTFVREDWLNALGLAEPTTIDEFEAMLIAFRDNAEKLLGEDADKMIPMSVSFDLSWRTRHLTTSFIPDALTEQEKYRFGFDDRDYLMPNVKEGLRKVNQWYNDGLIWKDFPLYGAGDKTEDNMLKAGYVGAFIHNWDYPYRDGVEGIHANLQTLVGPEAAFIAVDSFINDAGKAIKFLPGSNDRKIFLPASNTEPLASMLYLNWISKLDNRMFLQIGEEGVTHEVMEDGTVKTIIAVGANVMNSPNNIDYTLTINGLDLGDEEQTVRAIALGYGGVDERFISKAYDIAVNDARYGINYIFGEIKSEEGMGPALQEKRDVMLNQSVTAPVDQFDTVFDTGMEDYLASGGQAIIDERAAAWTRYMGE